MFSAVEVRTASYRVVLFGIVALLCSTVNSPESRGADEERLEELFTIENAFLQPQWETQLTFWPAFVSDRDDADWFEIGLLLELGLTDDFQVETAGVLHQYRNAFLGNNTEGMGDWEVGLKYRFYSSPESGLDLIAGVAYAEPTGDIDKGLTEGLREYEIMLLGKRDLWRSRYSRNASIHLQLLYALKEVAKRPQFGDAGQATDELFVGLGIANPIASTWWFTIEAGLATDEIESPGDETELFVSPGFAWEGPGPLELGLGLSIGLSEDTPDYALTGMLTWEFEFPFH